MVPSNLINNWSRVIIEAIGCEIVTPINMIFFYFFNVKEFKISQLKVSTVKIGGSIIFFQANTKIYLNKANSVRLFGIGYLIEANMEQQTVT